jgi:hypothetical protein
MQLDDLVARTLGIAHVDPLNDRPHLLNVVWRGGDDDRVGVRVDANAIVWKKGLERSSCALRRYDGEIKDRHLRRRLRLRSDAGPGIGNQVRMRQHRYHRCYAAKKQRNRS